MESVLQRLGFLVDTSGLLRGQAAMDAAAASGVRLGAAADLASTRLSMMGRGPAAANLQNVSTQMNSAAAATRNFNLNAEQVSHRLSMLGTAAGTVAGIFAFQLVASIANVVSELASIPIESARASDALTRFSSQLSFAFRGSAASVRQANADIVALAREAGVSLSQLRNDYADIAISGRAAGLTRSGVSDVVGAFAQLGQLSGADPGALSRSMYQYQQMLNIGTVRWADYRLADLNLPAFGDAVAAGESALRGRDVSSAELVGMISRGEMSAMRLTEALAEGVPRLLEESGGQLPQLMSRSQAAMESEWTLLLEDMGRAFRTSEFIQSLQYGIADLIGGARGFGELGDFVAMTPEERRQAARDELAVSVLQAEMGRRDEATQAREARHRNAFGIVTNLDPILAAQAQTRADIDIVQQGLADTTGLTTERVAELRRGLSLLEGQLARIESAVDRARRQSRESAADLARFGPGFGFDLARSSRGLVEQSISQMRPISIDQAIAIMLGDRLTGAESEAGVSRRDLGLRQRVVDAAGGNAAERRRAAIDYETERYGDQIGAGLDNIDPALAARQGALILQFRQNQALRYAQDDSETLRTRERSDQERIDAMREQLALGIRLGREGRIALAQAERERDLRREFPEITDEIIRAERLRAAELVLVSDELERQQRQLGLLADAARVTGSSISDALRAGIIEGARTGTLRASVFFDVLGDSALRVADRIMQAMMSPYEDMATNWISQFMSNLLPGMGGGGGKKFAAGGVFDMSGVVPFATGGIVTRPTIFPFANGIGLMGEAGAEAILPLKRGADGKLGVANNGGGGNSNVSIQIIDQRANGGAPIETEEGQGADGMRQVRVFVRDEVDRNIRSGRHANAMQAAHGAPRVIKQV